MNDQKEVFLNGDRYIIQAFGAIQGFRVGKKVAKVMLPAISKAFGEEEATMSDLMEVVGENLDHIDEQTVMELLSMTSKNKHDINFDRDFKQNYRTLFLLLWEIIQFNFSDLLFIEPPEEEKE